MKKITIRRYPLGLHRKDGSARAPSVCFGCGRGSKAGLDWWEAGEQGALLEYQCAIRLIVSLIEMGYDPHVEVVTAYTGKATG